jgi:hypothetical protein
LFRVVRNLALRGKPAKAGASDEFDVICCDNDTPTRAFLWAAGRSRGRDVQFNHLWTAAKDPQAYTALWNLCATPAFLAKLTDGKARPETVSVLQYRAFKLYEHYHEDQPVKPEGYDDITWRPTLEPVGELEAQLRQRLRENPKSRAALSARTIGWLFSNWEPDPTVGIDAGVSTA